MEIIGVKEKNLFAEYPAELQLLIWGFLANLKSPQTKIAYQNDLKKFADYIKERTPHLDLRQVQYEHIISYRLYLGKRGRKKEFPAEPVSINRALAALKKFYRFLFQKRIIEGNPVELVDSLRVPKLVKAPALSFEEWKMILSVPVKPTLSGYLHKAVIGLLFTTGMRKGELIGLRLGDLQKHEDTWVLECKTKGAKKILKPLNQIGTDALMSYLRECKNQGFTFEPENFLLRPSKNPLNGHDCEKPLHGKSIDYIVKKFCAEIGLDGKKFRTHSSRATVISVLYDKGVDLKQIRDFVGHANVGMTIEYIKRETAIKNSPAKLLEWRDV